MPVSIYDPRTMTAAIELMPPIHTAITDMLFKKNEPHVTETIEVDIVKGNRKLAPFVHKRIGGKIVRDSGFKTKVFTPVSIGPMDVTDADALMKRQAGESVHSGRTPAQRGAIKVGKDLNKLRGQIVRRLEWMCCQLIFTGEIPVIGDGLEEIISFGFDQLRVSTGDDIWSLTTGDPFEQLIADHKEVQKLGFVNCTTCLMADDVAAMFMKHPEVIGKLDTQTAIKLGRIDPQMLANGLTYIGTIQQIGLDIYTYTDWFEDDWTDPETPVLKSMIPEGHYAIVSDKAQFTIEYGAVTRIDSETEEFETYSEEMVPDTWIEKNPDRRMLKIDSKPLPIPHEVNSWLVRKPLG